MTQTDPCVVCQLTGQITSSDGSGIHRTQCRVCGIYDWRNDSPLQGRAKRQVLMSGYIRAQNRVGIYPLFTPELVAFVEKTAIPSLVERSQILLDTLASIVGYSTNPGAIYAEPLFMAATYSQDAAALAALAEILVDQGFATDFGNALALTPKGYLEVDGRRRSPSISAQGFVAMSFDKAMDIAFVEGFQKAIADTGYRPFRIDSKEHANGISDEIIAEIRRSRFVIADYTQMNNGVYFEAGFAIGIGIPVIPTCHKDDFSKLHFDIRHINTLQWSEPGDLREALKKRILAVIGAGPIT